MDTLTLHVGMTGDDTDEALEHTDDECSPWHTDGDGWQSWGDPVGTAGNSGAVHVQATVAGLDEAIALVDQWRGRLIPDGPIVGALTASAHWSHTVATIR
jgi:hypothetical protein